MVLVLVQLLLLLFLRAELSGFVFLFFSFPYFYTLTHAHNTLGCILIVCHLIAKQKCIVDLPGGPLKIEWREDDNHVYMTGPAEAVFYGSVAH